MSYIKAFYNHHCHRPFNLQFIDMKRTRVPRHLLGYNKTGMVTLENIVWGVYIYTCSRLNCKKGRISATYTILVAYLRSQKLDSIIRNIAKQCCWSYACHWCVTSNVYKYLLYHINVYLLHFQPWPLQIQKTLHTKLELVLSQLLQLYHCGQPMKYLQCTNNKKTSLLCHYIRLTGGLRPHSIWLSKSQRTQIDM